MRLNCCVAGHRRQMCALRPVPVCDRAFGYCCSFTRPVITCRQLWRRVLLLVGKQKQLSCCICHIILSTRHTCLPTSSASFLAVARTKQIFFAITFNIILEGPVGVLFTSSKIVWQMHLRLCVFSVESSAVLHIWLRPELLCHF